VPQWLEVVGKLSPLVVLLSFSLSANVSFDRVSNFQERHFYYTAKKLTQFLTQYLTQFLTQYLTQFLTLLHQSALVLILLIS